MAEQFYLGDKIELETKYGKFTGWVDRIDRRDSMRKYSLKLRGIHTGDNEKIPMQRFRSEEVIGLRTIERVSKTDAETMRNTDVKCWVQNDYSPSDVKIPSPKHSPTKSYRKVEYKFIQTLNDLQEMIPKLISVKELAISLEPSSIGAIEETKKIKLFTISTGKQTNFIIDFEKLSSMAIKAGLGKILESKSRLKLVVNCGEVSHALSKYYNLKMSNVLDLEIFGLTVDVDQKKNVPEYFNGFTALVRTNLGYEIPREITPDKLVGTIPEDILNQAALRAESMRPLKTKLQEQILNKAFEGTAIMMKSLRGKTEEDQNYIRSEQRRLKVDPKIIEIFR